MEEYAGCDLRHHQGYRARSALTASVGGLGKRRGVRRIAVNRRNAHAFYGTCGKAKEGKSFILIRKPKAGRKRRVRSPLCDPSLRNGFGT